MTSGTHTDGGAVIRKPGTAWLEGYHFFFLIVPVGFARCVPPEERLPSGGPKEEFGRMIFQKIFSWGPGRAGSTRFFCNSIWAGWPPIFQKIPSWAVPTRGFFQKFGFSRLNPNSFKIWVQPAELKFVFSKFEFSRLNSICFFKSWVQPAELKFFSGGIFLQQIGFGPFSRHLEFSRLNSHFWFLGVACVTTEMTQPACFEAHTDEASTQPARVVSINHPETATPASGFRVHGKRRGFSPGAAARHS